MSAETRAQFRERVGRIAANWHGVSWEYLDDAERHDYMDAGEASYATALRDVIDLLMADVVGSHGRMLYGSIANDIRTFAAERGIDLEGGDT